VQRDQLFLRFFWSQHLKGRERILILANDSDQPRQVDLATARTGLENCSIFTPVLPSSAPEIKGPSSSKLDFMIEPGATVDAVQ